MRIAVGVVDHDYDAACGVTLPVSDTQAWQWRLQDVLRAVPLTHSMSESGVSDSEAS